MLVPLASMLGQDVNGSKYPCCKQKVAQVRLSCAMLRATLNINAENMKH